MENKRKRTPTRICERYGNGGKCTKETFRCKYCGWMNGIRQEVLITRGGIDDR